MCSLLSRMLVDIDINYNSRYRVVYKCCRVVRRVNSPPGFQSRTPCFTTLNSRLWNSLLMSTTPVCSFYWHILSPPQPCFRLALCCFPQKLIAQPSDLCVRPCAPTAPAARTPASACPLSSLSPSRNQFFKVISDGQNNHSRNYRAHNSLLCTYPVYNIIALLDRNRVG